MKFTAKLKRSKSGHHAQARPQDKVKSEAEPPAPASKPEAGPAPKPGSQSDPNPPPDAKPTPPEPSPLTPESHKAQPINATATNRFLTRLALKIIYSSIYRRLHRGHIGPPVVNVSPKICIKASRGTTLDEANCMEFVARHTSIPVPKVYCAFERNGVTYIVMERVPGRVLLDGFGARTKESQDKILKQLKAMVDELHNLPPPDNVGVANVNGGPITDSRLKKPSYGPYRTIHEFHKDLREGLEARDGLPADLTELIAFHNEPWPTPVFTHGDLSYFNILADGDKVTGIIDWTTAGWLPPYWDYSQAMSYVIANPEWADAVDKFLTPMPRALEMDTIRKKYYSDLYF